MSFSFFAPLDIRLCSRCLEDVTSLPLHQAAEMDGVRLQWID